MPSSQRGGAVEGSPAYHAGDYVLARGEPGVVQQVVPFAYDVETAAGTVTCLAAELTSVRCHNPNDTPEREEVRRLMRGTTDTQGLPGVTAVLTVVACDRTTPSEALVRRALKLVAYAWGLAHGMHSQDLPDNPGVCGPHLDVMREGHADGLRVVPWETNPAPLPATGSEEA